MMMLIGPLELITAENERLTKLIFTFPETVNGEPQSDRVTTCWSEVEPWADDLWAIPAMEGQEVPAGCRLLNRSDEED